MAIGSRFARYINPVLDALRDLGGSGRPGEVCDWIAKRLGISDAQRDEDLMRSGMSRFENDVSWARLYLVKTGYLDSSKRGVWSLTEHGRSAISLADSQLTDIIRAAQKQTVLSVAPPDAVEGHLDATVAQEAEESVPDEIPTGYSERALKIMQALPPKGFEHLCQRLLREYGFQQVTVTGRSGDGGIDGVGVLQINPFVTFKVLFQCKRWANSVGPAVVRDFRGAMMGRADKGLILTTGTFTTGCQAEAVREGATPIQLVDGQGLVALLEELELGLIRQTTYDIDQKFFDEFQE